MFYLSYFQDWVWYIPRFEHVRDAGVSMKGCLPDVILSAAVYICTNFRTISWSRLRVPPTHLPYICRICACHARGARLPVPGYSGSHPKSDISIRSVACTDCKQYFSHTHLFIRTLRLCRSTAPFPKSHLNLINGVSG